MGDINYIGGLPVLIDNAYWSENGEISNYTQNNNYFITGFHDTGNGDSKNYTFSRIRVDSETISVRLYNNQNASSIDYWRIEKGSQLLDNTRTFSSAGRYIAVPIRKEDAPYSWCYCNTTKQFVYKGDKVDDKIAILMINRNAILKNSILQYGGIPVWRDNVLWYNDSGSGTATQGWITDNRYFLAGPFDTQVTSGRHSYTIKAPTSPDNEHNCLLRTFNSLYSSSINYWALWDRTFSSNGRYFIVPISKENAADQYLYDNTAMRYIYKGENINNF